MPQYKRLICAVDLSRIDRARDISQRLQPELAAIKLGLEFFTAYGLEGAKRVSENKISIFLDLKLHDIPTTVAKAIKNIVTQEISMITVHVLGGKNMCEAASLAAEEEASRKNIEKPKILGVTVLTSHSKATLESTGITGSIIDQVLRLAEIAKKSGLNGVVCSAHEVEAIRKNFGNDFITVVPGIRPEGTKRNDQERTMTPMEAVNRGADYLVVGRPITEAEDPLKVAKDINSSILCP